MNGRSVLITGAARGIGAETARRLGAMGARVALAGLEPDRLAEVSATVPGSIWIECDVTDQAAVDAAVARTVGAFGGLDVAMANAGIAPRGTIAASPVEAHIRTVEVNLLGVMRTVSAALPHLIESRGYALLIASAASFTALPGMAAYCASKAGVEHFGNALRLEVAHRGVAVGTVHPSWIDTDLVRDVKADLPTFGESLRRLPPPLGRTTTVEVCADAIVDAMRRRRRRVYVPRTVGGVAALRGLLTSALAERVIGRTARTSVPAMEREVGRLGRNFGAHSAESQR